MSRTKSAPLSVLAALCLTASAFATPVKFTFDEANNLAAAIAALDQGSPRAFDQGQGNPQKVIEHYPFAFNDQTQDALAHDLSGLKAVLKEFTDRRTQIADDVLKAAGVTDFKAVPAADAAKGDAKVLAYFNTPKEVDIEFVTKDGLGLTGPTPNSIPLSIRSALDPIRGDLVKPPASPPK